MIRISVKTETQKPSGIPESFHHFNKPPFQLFFLYRLINKYRGVALKHFFDTLFIFRHIKKNGFIINFMNLFPQLDTIYIRQSHSKKNNIMRFFPQIFQQFFSCLYHIYYRTNPFFFPISSRKFSMRIISCSFSSQIAIFIYCNLFSIIH